MAETGMDRGSAHRLYTRAQVRRKSWDFAVENTTRNATRDDRPPRRCTIEVNALCAFCHIARALHPNAGLWRQGLRLALPVSARIVYFTAPREGITVTPMASPSGAGVSFSGRF